MCGGGGDEDECCPLDLKYYHLKSLQDSDVEQVGSCRRIVCGCIEFVRLVDVG